MGRNDYTIAGRRHAQVRGLRFPADQHVAVRFAPLLSEFTPLYWVGSLGVNFGWVYASKANEQFFRSVRVERDGLAIGYKQGALPRLAPHLDRFGEGDFLTGFCVEDAEADTAFAQFTQTDVWSPEYLGLVRKHGGLHMVFLDTGLDYVFSPCERWLQVLQEHWPEAVGIDSADWIQEQRTRQIEARSGAR